MFIPYAVDVPMVRYPIANWVLMGVIAAVSFGEWMIDTGHEPKYPLALKPQSFAVWQLVTHQFAHGDIVHLASNLLFLFVFGNAVNAKLGHIPFLTSFVVSGFVAGLAWLILGNGLPTVGASGAIMGIMGIFLVLYPRNDVVVFVWIYFYTAVFRLSSWILIAIYLALDLLFTIIDPNGGVAYVAHLAGAAVGIAFAVGALYFGLIQSEYYEEDLLQMLGWMEKTPRHGKRK